MGVLRQSAAADGRYNDELAVDHRAIVGPQSRLAHIYGGAVGVPSPRPTTIQLRDNTTASNVRGTMMDDNWLPTLETDSPQEGIELAVKLSRLGMMLSQPSNHIEKETRGSKTLSPTQLIAAAHVIALNFQTIAAANDWWRHESARHNSG
jgi:hypothetical protein